MMHSAGESARRERFEVLFQQHARPLLGYALRRVERPEDAADALSEVMLVAWRRLDDVPAEPEARLWLFGVARGVLRNLNRSSTRRDRLGERLRAGVAEMWEPDHAQSSADHDAVRSALKRLSEDDREVLLLTAWDGFKPSEIATALGLPSATVRSRLHRALGRLRSELEEGERKGGPGHVGDGSALFSRHVEEDA